MEYIVFDLEFNQFYEPDSIRSKPELNCHFEVIQIGAIKLDSNFKEIDTFDALVKPQIYKPLHPFVEKLTHINPEELELAAPFHQVYEDFVSFIENPNNILVIWGKTDLQVLRKNVLFYNLDFIKFPRKYINIQKYASKLLKVPKGKNIGLQNAVSLLNIDSNLDYHDALNDAVYTGRILQKIYSEDIKPKTYYPHKGTALQSQNKVKKIFDSKSFIKQLAKMYDKEFSKEEIDMLLLAYRMGATQQFLIPQ